MATAFQLLVLLAQIGIVGTCAWTVRETYDGTLFGWHPVLMTVGVVFAMNEAILLGRLSRTKYRYDYACSLLSSSLQTHIASKMPSIVSNSSLIYSSYFIFFLDSTAAQLFKTDVAYSVLLLSRPMARFSSAPSLHSVLAPTVSYRSSSTRMTSICTTGTSGLAHSPMSFYWFRWRSPCG